MSKLPHFLYFFTDAIWKPKWKKEALGMLKGGKRFLNFKRDLLEADRIPEIESRIKDMRSAISERDPKACEEAGKQLQGTCEHSLKAYRSPNPLAENVEMLFVAIAIALGIRAYYVQPFRIPTGSMQPTLNGIIGHPQPIDQEWNKPNIFTRGLTKVTQGRTYMKIIAPADGEIIGIEQDTVWMWFTRTRIYFDNGKRITVNGSASSILSGLKLGKNMRFPSDGNGNYRFPTREEFNKHIAHFKKNGVYRGPYEVKEGQVLAQGWVDTGDLVLVDKFSYHFRKPKRGEVFVFETRGIQNIISDYHNREQERGSHYIKRLAGIPKDKLKLNGTKLYVNDKLASEPGFKKVMSEKDGYDGYYTPIDISRARYLPGPNGFHVVGENQYFAMGDNSDASSDSRYWGDIDEYLLVGPGLFTLWPFENFGFIR